MSTIGQGSSPDLFVNDARFKNNYEELGRNYQHVADVAMIFVPGGIIDDLARAGMASRTLSALSTKAKDLLRSEARNIWFQQTGRRAIWDGLQVHHRIPLEWAHLMPGDPNRVANLVGMTGPNHTLVTNAWAAWKEEKEEGDGPAILPFEHDGATRGRCRGPRA